MLICHEIELGTWTPDFSSSEQASPRWTRVSCSGFQLVNSLEWVDWGTNPVQVVLCESCGYPDCSPGNYVHLSRLGDLVIWSSPHVDESDNWAISQYTPSLAVRTHGAVALPKTEWERLRRIHDGVPSVTVLAEATRRVLADSWRLSAKGPARVDGMAGVVPMLRERLLATDRLEPEEAIRILSPLLDWLREAPEEPISGAIRDPHSNWGRDRNALLRWSSRARLAGVRPSRPFSHPRSVTRARFRSGGCGLTTIRRLPEIW
jgi:hypothetical protein